MNLAAWAVLKPMSAIIVIAGLAGCAEFDPGNCIGDPGTRCNFQMHLDAARRQCTIIDVRNPTEPAVVYSAAHGTSTYCEPQGWRNGR